MNRFIAFVKKETFHILRDVRTLIFLFFIPIVLVLLFGFAITTEIQDTQIAILDKSKDSGTEAIIDKLTASGYFIPIQRLQSSTDLQESFKKGDVKIAVVFPENFTKDLRKTGTNTIQVIADASDPNTANTLRSYVTSIIMKYQQEQLTPAQIPYSIRMETRMLYNPRLESAYYFVPGVITIIITLVSAIMTSVTIVREKELGTMEVLLVSPLKPIVIILGKSVPYIVLAMVNTLTILYMGHAVFAIPLSGSISLLIAECFLFVFTALSMGLLISTRVNTQRVALMISFIGLFLPTLMLSGFIFPVESMPVVLQWISYVVPAKWFITIIKGIMLKGVGLETIWVETLMLLTTTLALMIASIRSFKIRLS